MVTMPDLVTIHINGTPVQVPAGATVAVALTMRNEPCRTSVSGESRGPLCGMGICYECRVTIDGAQSRLACQTFCTSGMEVSTHE